MAPLILASKTITELREAARKTPRVEICGLITRTSDNRDVIFPADNVHPEPTRAFELCPRAQIDVFKYLRHSSAELLAVYHSHPDGLAVPSAADRAGLGYPTAHTLIIAPNQPLPYMIRAWRLMPNGFIETPIQSYD